MNQPVFWDQPHRNRGSQTFPKPGLLPTENPALLLLRRLVHEAIQGEQTPCEGTSVQLCPVQSLAWALLFTERDLAVAARATPSSPPSRCVSCSHGGTDSTE